MRCALAAVVLLAGLVPGQQYDHLTIVPDSLRSALAPVCARVETRGLADTTVTVAEVLASSPGRDNQEKVRNFIRRAYSEWGITHVLLAGDNEQIPCRLCWVEINPTYRDWIPTELYYSALDGSWDRDMDGRYGEPEDSVDLIPDVLLGRVPLATPAEMQAFADRFLVYTADSTAPYLQNVLFAGFDYSAEFRGEEACEIYDTLLRPETVRSIKVYDSHSGNHEDSVKHVLNRGMHVWVQYDHCNWFGMGCGWTNHQWLLYNQELAALTNAPNYSLNFSAGCFPSAFDSSTCVAEVLLTAPNGGCVATLGNTRLGFGTNPEPLRTGSHYYCEKVLEGLWVGSGHGSFAGLAIGQAQAAPLAESNVVWRWCHYEFLLAGVPAMPVWRYGGSSVAEPTRPVGSAPDVLWPSHVCRILVLRGRDAMTLTDALGRDVRRLEPGVNCLDGVPAGVYFLRTADRHSRSRGRVVKVSEE